MKKNANLIAAGFVFFGSITFSIKAVLVKLAYQYDVDTLSLLTLRMGFALPFFVAIAIYSTKKNSKLVTPVVLSNKDWGALAFLGIIGYFAASYLDFWGLKYISASMERLILFMYPTIVLLLNAVFFKEKINRIQIIALLITYVGISIVFAQGLSITQQPNFIFGGFLIFCCSVTYSIYLVGSGQLLPRLGTLRFTSHAMIFACLSVIIQHGIMQQWQLSGFAPQVYIYAFLMAVTATVLPTLLVSEGIRVIGASNASIIGSVGPISTILLAYIFLGERLVFWQWIGAIIVIGGVLLVSLQKQKKKKM